MAERARRTRPTCGSWPGSGRGQGRRRGLRPGGDAAGAVGRRSDLPAGSSRRRRPGGRPRPAPWSPRPAWPTSRSPRPGPTTPALSRVGRRGHAAPRARPQRRRRGRDRRPPGHPGPPGRLRVPGRRRRHGHAGPARARRPGRPGRALRRLPRRGTTTGPACGWPTGWSGPAWWSSSAAATSSGSSPRASARRGGRPGRRWSPASPPRRTCGAGSGRSRDEAAPVRPTFFAPFFTAVGRRPT